MQLSKHLTISTIRSGKGDCVHLRFIGATGQPHNIIVDSGPTSAAGEFRALTSDVQGNGDNLDALIITHYDDDHIGGILKTGDPGFQTIYFNAFEGTIENENLSAVQNQRLFHSLESPKVHASVIAGDVLEIDGAKITVHAPTSEMLERATERMKDADVSLSLVSDWSVSLDELMQRPFPASDSSIANQASIVFTFEYESTRILFCGDAWSESIPGGDFDLVKLPHHGSVRNISKGLLERLNAKRFLICADGTSHPNKQTIAMLIQHYDTVSIYSNYSWWMKGFLMPDDMKYLYDGKLYFTNT